MTSESGRSPAKRLFPDGRWKGRGKSAAPRSRRRRSSRGLRNRGGRGIREPRRQIDEKNYAASLESEGITDIMKFGYAFFSKKSAICR